MTELVPGYGCPDEVAALFQEYTDMLVAQKPAFAAYLRLQGYQREVQHLEEKYGPPHGRLYLLRVDGTAAGCIALRRLDEERCELKRLYVRPQYRGRGLAGRLVDRALEDARAIGYGCVLLDTFPFLEEAIGMYRRRGFQEVPSYNGSPMEDLIYLRLDLR